MARVSAITMLFLALYWTRAESRTAIGVLKSLVAECPAMEITFVGSDQCSQYGATPFSSASADADLLSEALELAGRKTGHICEISVCGNGKPTSGFCGVGQCTILGRNCVGGCIPGERIGAINGLKTKYTSIQKIA